MGARNQPVGWRLVVVVAAVIAAGVAITLAADGVTERALSATLRATGATSLALFLLAFIASSIQQLWPGAAGAWLLRNRRYLGVSFAVSHVIHLGLIGTRVAVYGDVFWSTRTVASLIPGAIAYFFILLMTITSFDRTTRALGRTRWKVLHKTGSYVIWVIFVGAHLGNLVGGSALYALPIALLLAALALRAASRLRVMRRRRQRQR